MPLATGAAMRTAPRPGFTLLEVTLAMAVVLILGAILVPTLNGLKGNADQRGAADAVRSRIADARGLAMEHGTPYRLALSSDGTRLRVAPDGPTFTAGAGGEASASARVIETKLEKVTAVVLDAEVAIDSDWVTIGTFLADGTCREDNATVEVREGNFPPMRVQLRGVTASSRLLPPEKTGGQP